MKCVSVTSSPILRKRIHAPLLIVNFTRLILLLLTFLAVTGEAVTLGLKPSDKDQVHGCVEAEIEKVGRPDHQETWAEDPMVPWLVWEKDLPMTSVVGKAVTCIGNLTHINHACGLKQRRHRWLAVDLI